MQVNDDDQDESGALEDLFDFGAANPYSNAPIHQEKEFFRKQIVNGTKFDESMLSGPLSTCKEDFAVLEAERIVNYKVNGI